MLALLGQHTQNVGSHAISGTVSGRYIAQRKPRLLDAESPVKEIKKDTLQMLTALTSVLDETDLPLRIREVFNQHVKYHLISDGRSGFAYIESQRNGLVRHESARLGDFDVLFQGALSPMNNNSQQVPEQSAAESGGQRIAHVYQSARATYQVFGQATEDLGSLFEQQLTKIKGSYSCVIYDHAHERLVVIRDKGGLEPLYWGVPNSGQGLLICTNQALAERECQMFEQFQAGRIFVSKDGINAEQDSAHVEDWCAHNDACSAPNLPPEILT